MTRWPRSRRSGRWPVSTASCGHRERFGMKNKTRTCRFRVALPVAVTLFAGLAIPAAAGAVTPPVVEASAGHVTSDALPTVQIDGVVWDQEIIGNTVYAVGDFDTARPAGSAPGQNTIPRSN